MKNYKVGDLIYDAAIYDGMNTDMGDLDFYKGQLPKHKSARILELCCGTGRLTIPIAKDGYTITGVDITRSMLEEAKLKASKEGVTIDWIEGDIRSLNLPDRYDFIFIPFNSIHHLYRNEDLFQAFSVVKKHLKEDGLFLFDCFNPSLEYIVGAQKGEQEIASFTTKDGRLVRILQQMRYERASQINRIEWHYHINGVFDSVQKLDMRMYFPKELDAYIQQAGFRVLEKLGNFEGGSFEDASEKQIYVCQIA